MKKNERSGQDHTDDVVPPALPKPDLHKLLFKQSEPEVQAIKDYVEGQCRGQEKVLHAEKVASERVLGQEHGVWDVHTDKQRWWVITNATNLYSQTLMPSLDYTLSFHIGLMARMASERTPEGSEAQQEFLLVTTRRMMQAGEAFDESDESSSPAPASRPRWARTYRPGRCTKPIALGRKRMRAGRYPKPASAER